jgi:hypothetical protein
MRQVSMLAYNRRNTSGSEGEEFGELSGYLEPIAAESSLTENFEVCWPGCVSMTISVQLFF